MNENFLTYFIKCNIKMNQLSYKPAVSNELGPMFDSNELNKKPDSNELNENTETYQRYNKK
jgi:hypothetical protein